MKIIYRLESLLAMACVVLLTTFSGCNKDEGESARARTERLLKSASWKLNKVTVDGVDQTNLYTGMILTAGVGTYTAQNGDPVWPSTGTWKLIDDKTIDRDNGVTVTIEKLDENVLTLSLVWNKTTYGAGRQQSVSGNHVFEMMK
ncbi:hypothetical protein KK083_18420 [Fulvivirgaceae bacterium PWU4]|uniref:Lipocalin-like domain-containing protein n=1 Tax=Chryseosolibacter histidini TaxID=2782349 RepID=A0AAP2GQF5_9BACT|nr:hypothetical protein [Chryseosolibacter histidini]MBT1698875.1 hypothetical protein [Chryseosolibacter histidini]